MDNRNFTWHGLIQLMDWMSRLDWAALVAFLLVWAVYTWYADHSPAHSRTISAAISQRRQEWLLQSTRRDFRIIDTTILGNLLTGVGFFSSTTILVLGGLMAMLGLAEQGSDAISRLPFSVKSPATAWELKVLLLLGIFIYAFFKFTWAFRLANYCSIMVGGLPLASESESEAARQRAEAAARLSILSGFHFNRGLRAYFFALAAASWFVGPEVMIVTVATVAVILYRREFLSRALQAARLAETLPPAVQNPPPPFPATIEKG